MCEDSEAGVLLNEIVSNKNEQSEAICCPEEFSVSQKTRAGQDIHHGGKSDSVFTLNCPLMSAPSKDFSLRDVL